MKTTLLIFLLFISSFSWGQDYILSQNDTINRIDNNGARQGVWRITDPQSTMKVLINFANDIPGDSILYFEHDLLRFIYIKSKQDSSRYVYYDGKFSCSGSIGKTTIHYCSPDSSVINQIKKFIFFEVYPFYYGGQAAMIEFLTKKIASFPPDEGGMVKVHFVIDKTGKPTEVKISNSENEKLNPYCVRTIQEMPRWQAGYQGGSIVTVPMILPINCK